MTYKGRVQGNVIVLDEAIPLPNGELVLVTVEQVQQGKTTTVTPKELQQRQDLVARMKEFGQRLEKQRSPDGTECNPGRSFPGLRPGCI